MVKPIRSLAVPGAMALVAAAVVTPGPRTTAAVAAPADRGWTGTWSVAYEGSGGNFPAQSTARQIVHTSIGGAMARLRLSNVFNDKPLALGDFHLAQRSSGASPASGGHWDGQAHRALHRNAVDANEKCPESDPVE